MNEVYPFTLKPLPYAYNALEPYIDEETMKLHHDKHLQTYIDNLNKALENHKEYHNWNLEKILFNIYSLPEEIQTAVRNNAGGVYNHDLYFKILGGGKDTGMLSKSIINEFGSIDEFYKMFKDAAISVFGSGYAWLVIDRNGKFRIIKTKNQDCVLEMNLYPILLCDVWEHAYYLKYNNRRSEYVDNFLKAVNWKGVEDLYLNFFRFNKM